MKTAFLGIAAVVFVAVLAAFVIDRLQDDRSGSRDLRRDSGQIAAVRSVAFTDELQVSRGQGPVLVQLESGTIPADVTQLHILTDENCAPDQDGVSHCLNRVRFLSTEGWGEAVLRHHHRMIEEDCLVPGETVTIAA